ncbi:GIY-YIG nuclease family protein [Winogradskyella sp.]|uniref:GIY-YIG nuclease family protein n=1 Tax=unclassified Winogradskyella TaxID=2615021 RepID=UPI001B23F821|nr:GIY-YIG nuclease family protein [Winogradskyella sp.]MBO6880125.1 GIY-YIG nuclease family protein [Winogradskyella sp.]
MPKRSYHNYWVYIVTNKPRGVLYTGFTGGIDDRMEKHKDGIGSYFASKYRLKRLVYYEEYQYVEDAIKREKQIKNWRRQWKINLIEESNPNWDDLWQRLDSESSSEQQTKPE